ncbi:thiol:disulfide interchange protein DsbA/DsbL [Endozoicomonas ascidiicola]|uniref:thiol:disulfide interchange protein DsbA/DsbL n=1 Tax=Endozoicomonas ascidiicola TaxID=1698521 RepID=UPI000B2D788F|nr:thiol:disulfide interchange protein DsbA/DsbL [Endozoicomonas ascidiicola]
MTKKTKGVAAIVAFLVVSIAAATFLLNDNNSKPTVAVTQPNEAQDQQTSHDHAEEKQASTSQATTQPYSPLLFSAGKDYRELPVPVQTDATAEQVEVVSVFWYGCPHCYALEPQLDRWKPTLPGDVKFIRTPGFFSPNLWQTHARLYYTVRSMGIEDKVHAGIFSEIQNSRNLLGDDDAMAEFLNREYGIEESAFTEAYKSFGVNNQLQQAFSKLKGYNLSGVPAIIIDGRYVVEPGLAGSLSNMPVIADFLIRKVKQDRKSS